MYSGCKIYFRGKLEKIPKKKLKFHPSSYWLAPFEVRMHKKYPQKSCAYQKNVSFQHFFVRLANLELVQLGQREPSSKELLVGVIVAQGGFDYRLLSLLSPLPAAARTVSNPYGKVNY